jgi:hypothetical protein
MGFFVVPPLVKSFLMDMCAAAPPQGDPLRCGIQPLPLTLTLKGIEIKEPSGDKTFVSLGESSSISTSVLSSRVRPYRGHWPSGSLTCTSCGTPTNLQLLGPSRAAAERRPKDEKKERCVSSVSNIVVEHGASEFEDRPFQTKHNVSELQLGIRSSRTSPITSIPMS